VEVFKINAEKTSLIGAPSSAEVHVTKYVANNPVEMYQTRVANNPVEMYIKYCVPVFEVECQRKYQ
jgi:hypothetical protein